MIVKKYKYNGFTLVELIVVITILSILGTISYVAMQGYSANARDSKRVSDIATIEKNLELYVMKTGKYPVPDSNINVTYSGSEVWTQGIIGNSVLNKLDSIDNKPLDPLLNLEYVYSVLNTRKEFQIGSILESENFLSYNNLLSNSNAFEKNSYNMYIKGNYNGVFAKILIGSTSYVLAVPSLISSDLGNPDIIEIIKNKLLAFSGFKNLADYYKNNNLIMTGSFDFGGLSINPLIYSGNIKDLSINSFKIKDFTKKLQLVYSNSILSKSNPYLSILNIDSNQESEIYSSIGYFINEYLKGNLNLSKTFGDKLTKSVDLYTLADDKLKLIFDSGNSYYTKNWNTNNCDPSLINIITASGSTFLNAYLLAENTILKVPNGTYNLSGVVGASNNNSSISLSNCSAIIGESRDGVILRSVFSESPMPWSGINSNTNSIISNFTFDGNKKNLFASQMLLLGNSNATISNISLKNAGQNLVALNIYGDNNFLDRIESYNNDGSGIQVYGNKNLLTNLKYYNSGLVNISGYGIRLYGISNILNNALIFNNKYLSGDGSTLHIYAFNGNTNSALNNIQTFNNNTQGLKLEYINNTLLNNIYSFNNGVGISFEGDLSHAMNNIFKDIYIYNNNEYGVQSYNSTAGIFSKYYGILKMFGNTSGNIDLWAGSTFSGGLSTDTNLGFSNGVLDQTGTMACTYHSNPNIVSSWGTNCIDKRMKTTGVTVPATSYTYGVNIGKQIKPIRWNETLNNWEFYGVDGVDYDSTKKVGEW